MFTLLNGIKILDLTTIVLGPYGTKFLADFGAEVIKIEPLSGDQFRSVRPGRSTDLGAGFVNLNHNKKSIAIDLATDIGREVLGKLIKQCDVVVHNMRPKSAEKFGLTYEAMREVKDNIVFCYAPGFGQNGEYADDPAYDDTIQAASGIAQLNVGATGEPRFLPTIVGDKVGGMHLALSVLAGLTHLARTGKGCCIEIPMFESVVSFLMIEQLAGQTFIPPLGGMGYDRLRSPNRKPFKTSDGFISMLPYSTPHWTRYLEAVGHVELAKEDWVRDPVQRSQRIDELYRIIVAETEKRTTDEWYSELRRLDIPCARVTRPDALLEDPHLTQANFFREYNHPTDGRMRLARSPFRVIDGNEVTDSPAPHIGQHSAQILKSLGYSDDEIQTMHNDQIFAQYNLDENQGSVTS